MFKGEATGTSALPRERFDGNSNRVLASLPDEEFRRVAPHLHTTVLHRRQVLVRRGEPIRHAVFPSGACALTCTMRDGRTIEVGGLGAEGVVGASLVLGQAEAPADVVVQVGGDTAHLMPADVFRAELRRHGPLYDNVLSSYAAFLEQLMQAAACNALHSAEQRVCRWLLMMQRRLQRVRIPTTHDAAAAALGVRRPTVTLVATALSRAGAIECARGSVTILDQALLEARSCECFRRDAAAVSC